MINNLRSDLKKFADPQKAEFYLRFFRTGPGQYGEGDKFIGVTVPNNRAVAKKYQDLGFYDLEKLIKSPIHEERLCALLILVEQFKNGDIKTREKIYKFYLANTKYINNWDLVDLSADQIIGGYLQNKPKAALAKLARSENLWEKRIAIVATFHFNKKGEPKHTLEIAKILMRDNHDLIHKSVGWMLREVGKRCDEKVLTDFLDNYANIMPRTMLRYAIERFPKTQRQKYLRKRPAKIKARPLSALSS